MKSESLFRYVAIISALHVVVLSFVMGLRHVAYALAGTLTATLVWGVVFSLEKQKRRAGVVVGAVVGLAVQQVAYHVWKSELPGFWWPLAQFAAVQTLLGYGIGKCAR